MEGWLECYSSPKDQSPEQFWGLIGLSSLFIWEELKPFAFRCFGWSLFLLPVCTFIFCKMQSLFLPTTHYDLQPQKLHLLFGELLLIIPLINPKESKLPMIHTVQFDSHLHAWTLVSPQTHSMPFNLGARDLNDCSAIYRLLMLILLQNWGVNLEISWLIRAVMLNWGQNLLFTLIQPYI